MVFVSDVARDLYCIAIGLCIVFRLGIALSFVVGLCLGAILGHDVADTSLPDERDCNSSPRTRDSLLVRILSVGWNREHRKLYCFFCDMHSRWIGVF